MDLFVARQAGAVTFEEVERTLTAFADAFERVLGASPGSLEFADRSAVVREWFGPSPSAAQGIAAQGIAAQGNSHDRHHRDREAHQELRPASRDRRRRPARSRPARRSVSWARTAPARPRRSGRCSTTSGRRRAGPDLRHRDDRGPRRHPSPDRLPAGRVRPLRPAHRRPDDRVLREPARRCRPRLPGLDHRASRRRPVAEVQGVLQGQQAEDRPGDRAPAPAGAADPGRADLRAGSARPADASTTLLREARAEGRTVFLSSHILSEVERTCDRVAIIREGRLVRTGRVDDAARPRPPPGRAAVRGQRPGGRVRRPARRLRRRGRGPHAADARRRLDQPGRPGRRPARAARLRLPRAEPGGDLPRRVRPRKPTRWLPDDHRRPPPDGGRAARRRSRCAPASSGSAASSARRSATLAGPSSSRSPSWAASCS